MLALASDSGLRLGLRPVAAHGLGDLAQVARAIRWNQALLGLRAAFGDRGQCVFLHRKSEPGQRRQQRLIQRRHPGIIELRGHRAEHRHRLGGLIKSGAVALHLLGDLAVGIRRSAPVKLVDRDKIGEIQHVNFFQLARCAVFGGHDIQRQIHQFGHARITLPDPRRLDQHQIKTAELASGEHRRQAIRQPALAASGGNGAHEDVGMIYRVHTDAVAKQRAAASASGRINRQQRDAHALRLTEPKSADQFIRERRLTRPAGTGDAEYRYVFQRCGGLMQLGMEVPLGADLQPTEQPGEREMVPLPRMFQQLLGRQSRRHLAARQHVFNHAVKAEFHAHLRGIHAAHAVVFKRARLLGHNHATAAGEHADLLAARLAQPADHVLQIFHMPALIRTDRNPLHILLQCRINDLPHRAVVPQMNHLRPLRLQTTPNDINRRIMPVKQTGRRQQPRRRLRMLGGGGMDGVEGHGLEKGIRGNTLHHLAV